MNYIKNPFCVIERTGEFLHIEDFISTFNYRNELVSCPSTKLPLTLKYGNVKVPHFALPNNTTPQLESFLHFYTKMLFKEMIGETLVIKNVKKLPYKKVMKDTYKVLRDSISSAYTDTFYWFRNNHQSLQVPRSFDYWKLLTPQDVFSSYKEIYSQNDFEEKIVIKTVEIEKKVGNVICDVLINGKYNIEIHNTNAVDYRKENLLNHQKLYTVEIDVRKIGSDILQKKLVKQYLLSGEHTKVFYWGEKNLSNYDNAIKEYIDSTRSSKVNNVMRKILYHTSSIEEFDPVKYIEAKSVFDEEMLRLDIEKSQKHFWEDIAQIKMKFRKLEVEDIQTCRVSFSNHLRKLIVRTNEQSDIEVYLTFEQLLSLKTLQDGNKKLIIDVYDRLAINLSFVPSSIEYGWLKKTSTFKTLEKKKVNFTPLSEYVQKEPKPIKTLIQNGFFVFINSTTGLWRLNSLTKEVITDPTLRKYNKIPIPSL